MSIFGRRQSRTPASIPPAIPTSLPPSRSDLLFCYFGDQPSQYAEVASHTNAFHVASWYSNNQTPEALATTMNQQLLNFQGARGLGLKKGILTVEPYIFTPMGRLLPSVVEIEQRLRAVLNLLLAGGCLDLVTAFYLTDEPNNSGTTEDDIRLACEISQRIWFEFKTGKELKTAVIYARADAETPGIQYPDWVGFDDYDRGATIFSDGSIDRFLTKINGNQRLILVPGGADPWKCDPKPFYMKAQNESRVAMIMPFLWFDNYGWTGKQGIRSNGLATSYKEIGSLIKAANPAL